MRTHQFTFSRVTAFAAIALVLTGCALPRTGPSRAELMKGSVENGGDTYVVPVDATVTKATSVTPALGFSQAFLSAGKPDSDIIKPGDVVGITIWENVTEGVLGTAGVPTPITDVQVDGRGFIFIPYAGRIRASGNTPEQLRQILTDRLDAQTPDPQVMVQRLAGNGATVSIVGGVGGQGVYPIERPTRTLSAMLANAGGVTIPPEIAQVTVIRGDNQSKVWLQDIYRDPRFDIALRAGDRILVEEDSRFFTALGATMGQTNVTFTSHTISAMQALAQVGGLNSAAADPKGIFVLRDEPEHVARVVLGRDEVVGPQRIVYVLDLTQPNGLFNARDFVIRDQDTIYVTEAPYVQFNKAMGAFFGTLGSASTLNQLTQ